ncbi:MAG: UDP-N-acetylmuramoyl-L-alanine--D-glutamate ligase [Thermoanaerobaculia bacterium]
MTVRDTYSAWKRVLVYGLGASGAAAARFLRAREVAVLGVDERSAGELELADLQRESGLELALGAEPVSIPDDIDAIVVSPGVPLDRPILTAARGAGIPIVAEVELAYAFLDGPVVGITGSNGKSTTTAMTGALLEAAGLDAEVCGNIGVPLVSVVEGPPGRIFVVELSSFQLETVSGFRPKAAALLNLSPDHLDRHRNLEGYLQAKSRVFARQEASDLAVLNADDPLVREVGTRARKRFFSRLGRVDDGCYLDGDRILEVEPATRPRELFKRSDVAPQGEHNLENAMAAALLARAMGASPTAFATALARFEALPHRMEVVALMDGVQWIDDSKGTNVSAVVKSLGSMPDGRVHLILGGRGKGESFELLAEPVSHKARRVYLIGETADELSTVLEGKAEIEAAVDLERAVARASAEAGAGDTVLLSPACTSFDQYRNFAARGDHFQELVRALVARAGAGTEPGGALDG